MKNQVIKVINKEHGKSVIEFWKSKGVDTLDFVGDITEESKNRCIYYGVIDRKFDCYNITTVTNYKAEIIQLPKENKDSTSLINKIEHVIHHRLSFNLPYPNIVIMHPNTWAKLVEIVHDKDLPFINRYSNDRQYRGINVYRSYDIEEEQFIVK